MDYIKKVRGAPGDKLDLAKVDASFTDHHESHQHALPEIEAYSQKLLPDVRGGQALAANLSAGTDGTQQERMARSTMCLGQ